MIGKVFEAMKQSTQENISIKAKLISTRMVLRSQAMRISFG